MSEDTTTIYESPQSAPMDEFWLEQGKKLVGDSAGAITEGTKSMLTVVGLLKGIYIGIIGFADYIPKDFPLIYKSLYLLPLLFWLVALHYYVSVLSTREVRFNMYNPEEIKKNYFEILSRKQRSFTVGVWLQSIGIVVLMALMIVRFRLG